MTTFGAVDTEQVLTRSVILTIDDFRKGVTEPTEATIGETPTIAALQHNAIGELTSCHVVMPADWDKTVDVTFDLVFSLRATEDNNDVLSVTVDYTTILKNTTGSGPGRTSTQLTPTVTVTTANGLAIGDVYTMSATLDKDDASNAYSGVANAIGFCFEFHLTNTTGVEDIDCISGCINYEAKY